jgi:hypothetical protein
MSRMTIRHPKSFMAILGLSCICMTFNSARSASPAGFEGGLTAYPFDGVYKGAAQRIAATDESCRPAQDVALEVRNGRFKLPWQGNQLFDASIARDGSFYATSGVPAAVAEKRMTLVPTLQGRISSSGLVADYGTRLCRYRLEASLSTIQHLSQRTDSAASQR